jgi:L-galactose dehydrogenase
MERLGVSYIDIVICHDIEFGDLDQVINETIPALKTLQAQQRIGFIGISGLPLKIFSYVVDNAPAGSIDLILSYCHTTMYDSTLTHLIPKLRDKGIGIINASPLGMGLLTNACSPPDWHPAPATLQAGMCVEL